jgi:hypothetical protein
VDAGLLLAAPFGMLVGYLLPREMEGSLLLTMVALQMIIDAATAVAKATPFWSSREIGPSAVDDMGTDYPGARCGSRRGGHDPPGDAGRHRILGRLRSRPHLQRT